MRINELFKQKNLSFSLEIFPPKKTSSVDTIFTTLAGVNNIPADFISVTYGAGGSEAQKNKTIEISSLIKKEYYIEPLPHMTCIASTKQDVIHLLDSFKDSGVENILALRGDKNPDITPKHDFEHASDMVKFIKQYNPTINISGACYPEGHCECDTIEQDIENLKIKIDAGVSHLISQLFFDNTIFYRYLEKLNAARINIPVDAGIMPIINKNQIEKTVSMCGASIPHKFSIIFNRYADNPEALKAAGIAYATEQIIDLISNGVRGIHLYTMNNIEVATTIYNNIKSIIEAANRSEQL
mgnify:CR=1 FL=1